MQLLLLVLLLLLPELVKLLLHLLVEAASRRWSSTQLVQAALDDVALLLAGCSTVSRQMDREPLDLLGCLLLLLTV